MRRTLTLTLTLALLAVMVPVVPLVGCASTPGVVEQSVLAEESRRAFSAINAGLRRVEDSAMIPEEKDAARKLLGQLAESVAVVDKLAARTAGFRLSELEAAEAQASLSMVYRQAEALALRPPASLARGGATLNEESRETLEALQRLLR